MMLDHAGHGEAASRIRNALNAAIEDGVATRDMGGQVGTMAFADAIIVRLGDTPRNMKVAHAAPPLALPEMMCDTNKPPLHRECVGIDIFVQDRSGDPDLLAAALRAVPTGAFDMKMITNRGVKVWPNPNPDTILTDHWRCRFMAKPNIRVTRTNAIELALLLSRAGIDVVKTEGLYNFDGQPGYSLGQGQEVLSQ